MSQHQVAANERATRNLAARLERAGYPGDPQAEAEVIVAQLLADGLAPIPRPEPIPPKGTGGSHAARAAALKAAAEAVAAAKARRQAPTQPEPAATPRQLTKLAILLSEDGVRERQERLDWCSAMVGRDLTSSDQLTRAEAHRLIESLEAAPEPDEPPVDDDPFGEQHQLDQDTWTDAEPSYVYAGAGDDEPPF